MFSTALLNDFYTSLKLWAYTLLISFKVPEVPKEVIPEKKVPRVVPKKPEVPPAKGTCDRPPLVGGGYSLPLQKCFVLCKCDQWMFTGGCL